MYLLELVHQPLDDLLSRERLPFPLVELIHLLLRTEHVELAGDA